MNAVAANKEADSLGAGGADWKFALLGALPRAPRIFTAATFLAFAKTIRPDVSSATSRLLVGHLIRAQALRRVTQGTADLEVEEPEARRAQNRGGDVSVLRPRRALLCGERGG